VRANPLSRCLFSLISSLTLSGCGSTYVRSRLDTIESECKAQYAELTPNVHANRFRCMTDRTHNFYQNTAYSPIYLREQSEMMEVFVRWDRGEITELEANRKIAQIKQQTQQAIARTVQLQHDTYSAQPAAPQVVIVQPAPLQPAYQPPQPSPTMTPSCAEGYKCTGRHQDADGVWR
jgi:hypothetical protein